ncbi:MAG TPA: MlaD family protein [Polyangiaceae bacterium]|nr:MlaD family protein [Polyangiaceae bacterium]
MSEAEPEQGRGEEGGAREEAPKASVRRHLGFSWIWLLPLAALCLVAYLFYGLAREHGPTISITFESADGLTAQQTLVRYRAVTLGVVQNIELSDDLAHVVVQVRMSDEAKDLLNEKTRFWVARPRFSGGLSGLQTGLETLVSGAYVAMDPGPKGAKPQSHFVGLEKPPSVRRDQPGSVYFLAAKSIGGIGEGAPIYYRDVNVGEVLSYELNDEEVRLRVFVQAPYDKQVKKETRFWNSSGFSVETGADGLHVELQSIKSLLAGGIAFGNPPRGGNLTAVKAEETFRLYPNRDQAQMDFYPHSVPYVSYFLASARGLSRGSEVHMFGKPLGTVTDVSLVRDPRSGHGGRLGLRVAYVLQPERALRDADRNLLEGDGMRALLRDNLRVVLRTSNLLTGQKELSLEYVPGAEPAGETREGDVWVLPSTSDDLQDIGATLGQIADKLNHIPFAEMGDNANQILASIKSATAAPKLEHAMASLDSTLQEAGALAKQARKDLGPALARLPVISEKLEQAVDGANQALGQSGYGTDSAVQRDLERTMSQVADAARSIRLLADFLNRHPEALVGGRRENEQ